MSIVINIPNLSRRTIYDRIERGLSVAEVLSVQDKQTKLLNFLNKPTILDLNGVKKELSVWANEYNLNKDTIRFRLKRGWTVVQALKTPVK